MRSCTMPGLPAYLVQELNVGTVCRGFIRGDWAQTKRKHPSHQFVIAPIEAVIHLMFFPRINLHLISGVNYCCLISSLE